MATSGSGMVPASVRAHRARGPYGRETSHLAALSSTLIYVLAYGLLL